MRIRRNDQKEGELMITSEPSSVHAQVLTASYPMQNAPSTVRPSVRPSVKLFKPFIMSFFFVSEANVPLYRNRKRVTLIVWEVSRSI
jgi:hypothetical protein